MRVDQIAELESELVSLFDVDGSHVFLHARDLDGKREIGVKADDPVVLASVFKIPILLELAKQAEEGRFALTDRIRVDPRDRVLGGTGLSSMLDEAELSLRDLALLMMSVSDNTATDVLLDKVGLDRVNETLKDLGLKDTELVGSCRAILQQLVEDVVGPDVPPEELPEAFEKAGPERAAAARVLRPELTSRSTPRETTELLSLIWTDRAASPDVCAEVRRILGLQVWPHRLRAGFPEEVKVAGKTGTILLVRNEAGVVEYPDGSRFAVAVFTRTRSVDENQPNADRVIGTAARKAVEHLRSLRPS